VSPVLRTALRNNPSRVAVARDAVVPVPVGGLNARDAEDSMPAADALTLDNWFPEASYLRLRRGFTAWATGFPAAVETLMEWSGPASSKFLAASRNGIYDITAGGAIGAAGKSVTNARLQHTMFSNTGGNYLVAVNGADGVLTFDGTTWTTQAITGATATAFNYVSSWGRRLWFGSATDSKAYYLGVDAIAGPASAIDLGAVWRRGGALRAILSVSFDTGTSGLNNYLGFLSSNGELAVYGGTDPAAAATFGIVGRYQIGTPVGARSWTQYGGDILLLTQDGCVSLTKSIQLDRANTNAASTTDKIVRMFSDDWRSYNALFGWQVITYANGHAIFVNVPTSGTTSQQYVQSTVTGAWCRYTGMNARCWGLYSDNLYFGGANAVYRSDIGTDDAGAAIVGRIRTAFNRHRTAGVKRYTMVRPTMRATGDPKALLTLDVDFERTAQPVGFNVQILEAQWDTAKWDVALWPGSTSSIRGWTAASALGRVVSVGMATSTIGAEINLTSFDLMFEPAQSPVL
jgi:hypothetical protein